MLDSYALQGGSYTNSCYVGTMEVNCGLQR